MRGFSFSSAKACHFSSATTTTTLTTRKKKLPELPSLPNVHHRYKLRVLTEAQTALTEYLHNTRSVPYAYADHIGRNSPFLAAAIVSKLHFKPSEFPRTVRAFLSYHPINEFEFFFESIGINPHRISDLLPANRFFFSEDSTALDVACALSDIGFPWNMLGRMYEEAASVFGMNAMDLKSRVCEFKDLGFHTTSVIAICLAFPFVLSGESEITDAVFNDLKMVFIDFGLGSSLEENVEAWYGVCRKIRVFYDLGCEKGEMGELMGRSKHIFIEYPEEVLMKKLDFFRRLLVRGKENAGLLLLDKPEILNFDLENRTVSVLGFLRHFELSPAKLESLAQEYPHFFGRNKISNVPHVMRALGLHEWLFDKIKNEDHNLLVTYTLSDPDEDMDKGYTESLEGIYSSATPAYTINKLNFLHSSGFGENYLTMKMLSSMHGKSANMHERFNCLLGLGIEFSMICRMMILSPTILNQNPESIKQKVMYLSQGMGLSLKCLESSSPVLNFDLENRIKPRHKFYMFLIEKGLSRKHYSVVTMIATSNKVFLKNLYKIHPALPKYWLECLHYRRE